MRQIESNYADDHVKIEIREDRFTAPRYLVNTIKELIQAMVFQTTMLTWKSVENASILTDRDTSQLKIIAENWNCEIQSITVQTNKEAVTLPTRKLVSTSKYLLRKSQEFHSTLPVRKTMSTGNHTMEVHNSDHLMV